MIEIKWHPYTTTKLLVAIIVILEEELVLRDWEILHYISYFTKRSKQGYTVGNKKMTWLLYCKYQLKN